MKPMSDSEFKIFVCSQLAALNERMDLMRDLNLGAKVKQVDNEGMEKLQERIFTKISASWENIQKPLDMSEIARAFARRTSMKDVQTAIDSLVDQKKIMPFIKATGTTMYLPESAREQLTSEMVKRLRFYNLGARTVARVKESDRLEEGTPKFTAIEQEMMDKEAAIAAAHFRALGLGGSESEGNDNE